MKKILFIMAMLTATTSMCYSQNADLQKWIQKDEHPTQKKKKAPNLLKDASVLINKSATYQYAALGCVSGAAGFAITASIIGTKKYEDTDSASNFESDRKLRRGLYIGAGVFAVAAICFEVVAIDYKTKAGHAIKLYSTGTGGGLAYVF